MATTSLIETWACPREALRLQVADRTKVVAALVKRSPPGGFPVNAHAAQAPISFAEEVLVVFVLTIIMGGPLGLFVWLMWAVTMGTWWHCALWFSTFLVLAFHPLPRNCERRLAQSAFTTALYRYFSYRIVWENDTWERGQSIGAWIGAGPPHGVLPLANILSISAINNFCSVWFVGAAASVVWHTPFLRYMLLYGVVDVSGKSIAKATAEGASVGVVPDGIAGIFRTNLGKEVVLLKRRKGLAKLALRTGRPLCPAYSIGNTQAFSAAFDSWGIMESVSRRAQAALFPYWGRFGLPIPRRCNVTILLGEPIVVQQVDDPTEAQVDAVHNELLSRMKRLFDAQKAMLGWQDKELIFE